MLLEVLYHGGLLLAVAAAAFAISSVFGMLVTCLGAPSRALGTPPDDPGSQ